MKKIFFILVLIISDRLLPIADFYIPRRTKTEFERKKLGSDVFGTQQVLRLDPNEMLQSKF